MGRRKGAAVPMRSRVEGAVGAALRPTTRPSRGAHREVCPRRELRPARVAVGPRRAADEPCTSPPRRRPKSPRWHLERTTSAPAVEPGGRHRRYGVPMGPRWTARGRYFVRVTKVGGASGGRLTSSLRHDLTGPWLDHHSLPHITLYDPRPLGRAASPRTPCGKPRRAVGPNRRFGGEWRAMVYYYMVCDHTTHSTCTATTTPPTPTSLVHTRPAPGFEPRKMPQQPPPPPPERVQVEGAFFALGVSE